MREWQTIETAPKDGTNIMIWVKGYDWPEIIRYELYSDDLAREIGEAGYWRYSEDLLADVAGVDDDILSEAVWCHLPEPPNQ